MSEVQRRTTAAAAALVRCHRPQSRSLLQCGPDNPTYHEANDLTYGNLLCANFSANCSTIAWSGKGLYVNSPTAGTAQVMPEYYVQVRARAV